MRASAWLLVAAGSMLGCAGRGGEPPGRGTRAAKPVDAAPAFQPWTIDPYNHPEYPPDRFLCAVGASDVGEGDAERRAAGALLDELRSRLESAKDSVLAREPASGAAAEATLAGAVEAALGDVEPHVEIGATARDDGLGTEFALAVLDRESAVTSAEGRRAAACARFRSLEQSSLDAAVLSEWLGFVQQAKLAVEADAERSAAELEIAALSDPGAAAARPESTGLVLLRETAAALQGRIGWTLRTDFDWSGPPPPGTLGPRVEERFFRLLLDRGFRVALGTGCPVARRVLETERAAGGEPSPEDEAPEAVRYLIQLHVEGRCERSAFATWDVTARLVIEIERCAEGTVLPSTPIGELRGQHPGDPAAAYLRAFQDDETDRALATRLREIGLFAPDALAPVPE
jgi:hypothetical protein